MALSRGIVLVASGLVALASLAGCSSAQEKDPVDTSESALASSHYLGIIHDGETKTSVYESPPHYRAYGFYASGGDDVTVRVSSLDWGDAMGWITTSRYRVLASNDDASYDTLDAEVTYHVPEGTPTRSYRIVFRDYDLLDATFTVNLAITSALPVTCSYDGQTYDEGDSFPAADGCNTCSCGDYGVVCTKMACNTCDPENEPNRNYLGDPSSCQTLRFSCSAGQHAFQNACGCGCESY